MSMLESEWIHGLDPSEWVRDFYTMYNTDGSIAIVIPMFKFVGKSTNKLFDIDYDQI